MKITAKSNTITLTDKPLYWKETKKDLLKGSLELRTRYYLGKLKFWK